MTEPFNKLTLAESERLAKLSEELGEAAQIIGKILLHGYASVNPVMQPSRQIPNRVLLERELGDVLCAISLLTDAGDLHAERIAHAAERKARRIQRWLHHQGPRVSMAERLEQLGVLVGGEGDVDAAALPAAHVVVEVGDVVGVAAQDESAELVGGAEAEVLGADANGGAAVGLDEVDGEVVGVVVEVEQNAVHATILEGAE